MVRRGRDRPSFARGVLKLRGLLRLGQLWPDGDAPADQLVVQLEEGPDSGVFRPHPGRRYRPVTWLSEVRVQARRRRPLVDQGRIRVQLRGIDAPELRYRPRRLGTGQRAGQQPLSTAVFRRALRQPLAESASLALQRRLGRNGQETVRVEVRAFVDTPGELLDAEGRLLAEVVARQGRRRLNLSEWLLRQGWAFPALRASMSRDRIEELVRLTRQARRRRLGVWLDYVRLVRGIDWTRVYRRPRKRPTGAISDTGRLLLPVLFRNAVDFEANREAGRFSGSLGEFLEQHGPRCRIRRRVLEVGAERARQRPLTRFLRPEGLLAKAPEDLVYPVDGADLVDGDGVAITGW